jgi:isoleucyl-tRNA synthetase
MITPEQAGGETRVVGLLGDERRRGADREVVELLGGRAVDQAGDGAGGDAHRVDGVEAVGAALDGAHDEFVFYDGPAVRERAAALRAPADRLRQGRRAALPDDARASRVERRFGWDCHGLPAEMEAEKELGIKRPRGDPCEYGIEKFNDACRTSVLRYTGSGALRHPPGPLGRLRQRLQDDGPLLHGERAVGVQAAVRQGPGLRGHRGDALLVGAETPVSNFETRIDDATRPRQDPALTWRSR